MEKILIFCRIQLKVSSWLYTCKKRWHTSWKFQLEKTSNKKVIAKKPLTNLYEMNSKFHFVGTIIHFGTRTCSKSYGFREEGPQILTQVIQHGEGKIYGAIILPYCGSLAYEHIIMPPLLQCINISPEIRLSSRVPLLVSMGNLL